MTRELGATALFTTILFAAFAACSDDAPPGPTVTGACAPPPRATSATVSLEPALGGQTFSRPIEIVEGPGRRFYVLEQAGVARVVSADGATSSVALDLSSRLVGSGEAGLLGIAFDPAFAETGFVELYFTENFENKPNVPFQSVIARFQSKDGGATFDPTTEKRILSVDQPYSNHNGGKIAFGPDGFLYIAFGDGGSGNDPEGNGQNTNTLLGAVLRIDPKGGDPYAIPPDNPFAGGGGRPEIFAYGLRNPWKCSFDKMGGDLWCGDVGQMRYEEIDRIVRGGNYGWNVREGKRCRGGGDDCPNEGFVDPVVDYPRSEGTSVTGGYVYRGTAIPSLYGKYVYGDFNSGQIWAVEEDGQGGFRSKLLLESDLKIPTFAQDSAGEVYVADYVTGAVKKLVAAPPPAVSEGPGARLLETGCVDPSDPSKAPPGLVAYTVASPLWSDGADKHRFLYVPPDKKVGVSPDGDLDVPPGSVAVKTFTIGGRRVETRLFVRYEEGDWAGYSYEWNDEQTDATLLTTSKTRDLGGGASWYFPSRGECFACHTQIAGFTLGLEARQLNVDDGQGNVLDRLAPLLASTIPKESFPALAAADTAGASDEARARGYLHANCSFCHREGSGTGAATFDLRAERAFADTRTCNAAPQAGDVGVSGARILLPGDPSRSTLSLRMRALDTNRMPPLATRVVDEAGASAVEAWIRGLSACP